MLFKNILKLNRWHYVDICRNCHFETTQLHQIFEERFGFSTQKAVKFVSRYRLYKNTPDDILEVLKCCRQLGFSDSEILREPNILRMNTMLIDQRYLMLEEGGFTKISPFFIWKYRSVYNRSVVELKKDKLIDQSTDVAQSFIKYLNPCPDDFAVSSSDEDLWSVIHRKVATTYLKWRLYASDYDVERLLRIHKVITYKCMRYLCENIQLAIDLGLSTQRILKCGYVLHSYPKYTKEVLRDLGNLAGGDMATAMKQYPKLMNISPKNIIRIYGILKEYNISDECIRNQMNVFTLSPETVRLRLEEIKSTPELSVLMTNHKILRLVVYHARSKKRLSFLQKVQLKCADRIVLTDVESQFENYVKEGKDQNAMPDVMSFLKNIFHKDVRQIRKKWKKHPFCLQVPLVDMQETLNCLREFQFHIEAIYRVIHILLYPKEKVTSALEEISNYESMKSNALTQVQKLNLVLYHIEKQEGFTGKGISRYTKPNKQELKSRD